MNGAWRTLLALATTGVVFGAGYGVGARLTEPPEATEANPACVCPLAGDAPLVASADDSGLDAERAMCLAADDPARSGRGKTGGAAKALLGERIDPNGDDPLVLTRLPGVGPAMARRIIDERRRGGPYRVAEDLLRVRGVGPKKLARMEPYLSLPRAARARVVGGDR